MKGQKISVPFVSVIIPVYNAKTYLNQALDSVLSQSLRPIEIICINDGSTDNSADILYEYEKKHKHMFVVTISNRGAGFARNLGVQLAKGTVVSFLDPDDYYPDDRILEKLYTHMTTYHVNICGGSAAILRGNEIGFPSESNRKYTFNHMGIQTFQDYQWSFGFWRFLYDRQFLIKHNICFPDYRRYQDPPFMAEAMVKADSFLGIPDISYVYRERTEKKKYTYIETRDALKGTIDVLMLTYKNNLTELNRITARNIDTELCLPIVQGFLEDQKELYTLLEEARRWLLIPPKKAFNKYHFLPELRLREYDDAKMQERKLLAQICSREKLILYGVGDVGKQFIEYFLPHLLPVEVILAVSHKAEDMPVQYHGIDIREIKELANWKREAFVLITTKDHLHREMEEQLSECGYQYFDFLDYDKFQLYSMKLNERQWVNI